MIEEIGTEIEGPIQGEPVDYNWVGEGELEVIINAGAGQRAKETYTFESVEMIRGKGLD